VDIIRPIKASITIHRGKLLLLGLEGIENARERILPIFMIQGYRKVKINLQSSSLTILQGLTVEYVVGTEDARCLSSTTIPQLWA